MSEELIFRLLDYGIAGALAAAILFWFAKRAEKRLDAVATQLRVLTFVICEANDVDPKRAHELEHLLNGGKS